MLKHEIYKPVYIAKKMNFDMAKTYKTLIKPYLTEQQINLLSQIYKLWYLAYDDVRVNMLGQVFPMKPTSLSMMANDVCNSRCQMCSIWQQKKDQEITVEDLSQVLSDPFFSEVRHVGITGGEPTLRPDLPELYRVICTSLPKINAASIITNAILEDVVKERVLASAEVCKQYNINFGVMVSLDGVGEVHDEVRGRKGNFDSAIHTINYFQQQNIPVSFGCTITRSNALYVDELLDYAISEGLYGRFRIAEFIDRLYNSTQTKFIRNFDEKTAYHLGLFFFRAEHNFETHSAHQKTYRSIRAMLTEGKPRQIGCPYHTQSVILTSRGDLLYCSPKSPILGNVLINSPGKIYFSNLAKRREMIKKDCDNCIHDYHVPVTFREKVSFFLKNYRIHQRYNCDRLLHQAKQLTKQKVSITDVSRLTSKQVLIVGWYGTETSGDKAILWTVIQRLRSRADPPERIYLASLYPFISEWTVKEMELGDISVIETYSPRFEQVCHIVNEVVVGGGPLMDIEALNHILYAAIQATKTNAIVRVEGCGIGPLVTPLYTRVVTEMLKLADHITLRDDNSTQRCIQDFAVTSVETVADPATVYVEFVKAQSAILTDTMPPLGRARNIACFLREWGQDYAGQLSEAEYSGMKHQFETQLVEFIIDLARAKNADIHLLPMHTFQVGGDDRVFNRLLTKKIASSNILQTLRKGVNFARAPVSPLEILQSMHHAEFNLCMRFHSVLFAETLEVPYLAIDYTSGGKIKAFLEAKNKLNRLISLQEIATGAWKTRFQALIEISSYSS